MLELRLRWLPFLDGSIVVLGSIDTKADLIPTCYTTLEGKIRLAFGGVAVKWTDDDLLAYAIRT